MPLVKLSIYPEPVEVAEDEIPGLRSQGLVEDGPASDPAPDPAKPAADAAAPVLKEETK